MEIGPALETKKVEEIKNSTRDFEIFMLQSKTKIAAFKSSTIFIKLN
jgi:hypothetical protein